MQKQANHHWRAGSLGLANRWLGKKGRCSLVLVKVGGWLREERGRCGWVSVAIALPSEKENFTGFGRENPKQGAACFYFW